MSKTKEGAILSKLFVFISLIIVLRPVFADSPVWQTQGGSFDRTGFSYYSGPEQGCIKWEFTTGGEISTSIAIGSSREIYLSSEDGFLYAIDPNGSQKWSYDAGASITSSPTIDDDGVVYVGTSAGELKAVNPDGSEKWSIGTAGSIYTSPARVGDLVLAGSVDGNLYAFDTSSNPAWTFSLDHPDSVVAGPSVDSQGRVYIGCLYDSNLYALDSADGSILWSTDLSHHIIADDPSTNFIHTGFQISPVIHPDGMVLIAPSYDSNLYALDPADGTIIWSLNLFQFPEKPLGVTIDDSVYQSYYGYSDIWSEPVVGPDGTIYVSMDDMHLRAVNPDGTLKWSRRIGMYGGFTMTVDNNGYIYAASDDKTLYVIEPDYGNVISVMTFYDTLVNWMSSRNEEWLSYPVLGGNGLVYVSSSAGKVYAVASGNCQSNELHWPANLSGDAIVNLEDMARLAAEWQECFNTIFSGQQCNPDGYPLNFPYPKADMNRDFHVNMDDLKIFVEWWLQEDNL